MTDAPLRAELLLDPGVPEGVLRELVDTLAALGVRTARTRRALVHRGPAELHWIVLVSLPLHAFLGGLGTEAARDAYVALRGLAGRLGRRDPTLPVPTGPDPAPRPMVLQDQRTGLRIVLESGLPEDAYEQLLALDLSRFRLGPVHFDQARGRWRSELDEAAETGEPADAEAGTAD